MLRPQTNTIWTHTIKTETEILFKNGMVTVIISPAYIAKGSFFFSPASAKGNKTIRTADTKVL